MEHDAVRHSSTDKTGDVMTTILHLDKQTWTESEFLAIGETPERIELFDGSLHVTPDPLPRHQYMASQLLNAMNAPSRRAGLFAFGGLNIRLHPGHIRIPDFVITSEIDFDELVVDASSVPLICEILSPSNQATDRIHKMRYYAEAGIPWYLLVEPKTGVLELYRLDGDRYTAHATAAPGELLEITEPVAVTIDPADLLPPR
jgi:Uma2 family endonuclease